MDKYTKFILTVIAMAMIEILFKGEKVITSAHAIEKHQHNTMDVFGLDYAIRMVIQNCRVSGIKIGC
tara:strand:+ start:551 stop:751 length:201 start_codon:yes stop_codon:yes gene_type:complete